MKFEFEICVDWCDSCCVWYSKPVVASSIDEILSKIKELLPYGHYSKFEFEGWWLFTGANDDEKYKKYEDIEFHFCYKPPVSENLIDDKMLFIKLKHVLGEIFNGKTEIDISERY